MSRANSDRTASAPSSPTRSTGGGRIFANTSALTSASLWRIVVSFALQLLIARNLGIAALGHYAAAMAYLNVAAVFSEVGLPNLLVRDLAQEPTHRRSRFFHALAVQFAMTVVVAGLLLALTFLLPFSPVLGRSLQVGILFLPFYAAASVALTLFKAAERMPLVFYVELFANGALLLASLVVMQRGGGVVALILVLVVAQGAAALFALWLVVRSTLLAGEQRALPLRWRALVGQALPFHWLALADVLLQRLDLLLLGVVAGRMVGGDVLVGIYSAANNLMRVAGKLVQSFWWAVYPTLSRLRSGDPVHYGMLRARLAAMGYLLLLPATVLGMVLAPELIDLVYGQEYAASAPVFRVLAPVLLLYFGEMLAVTTLMVERRPLQGLLVMGAHLAVLAATLPWLTVNFGAAGAASATLMGAGAGVVVAIRLLWPVDLARVGGYALRLLWPTLLCAMVALYAPGFWIMRLLLAGVTYAVAAWFSGALRLDRYLLTHQGS